MLSMTRSGEWFYALYPSELPARVLDRVGLEPTTSISIRCTPYRAFTEMVLEGFAPPTFCMSSRRSTPELKDR